MNDLTIFKYEEKEIRTLVINNDPYFVAKDVCDILELEQVTRALSRLDEDEVTKINLTDSMGRKQETNVINESGLYNLILKSEKPEAKKFKKWVTSEVLPSIRKTGGYVTYHQEKDFNLQSIIQQQGKIIENNTAIMDKMLTTIDKLANSIIYEKTDDHYFWISKEEAGEIMGCSPDRVSTKIKKTGIEKKFAANKNLKAVLVYRLDTFPEKMQKLYWNLKRRNIKTKSLNL